MSGGQASGEAASRLIDQRIADLGGWRGETLARMRALILAADPAMTEEWKWMGTPVWAHDGIVCTGESYKQVVKLTFAHGASLPDPAGLFNASLEGNTRRAIDIREGEVVDARAFKALVKAAVARNAAAVEARAKPKAARKATSKAATKTPGKTAAKPGPLAHIPAPAPAPAPAPPGKAEAPPVKLLSGGNPKIAKADGDAPVQAYIAGMPGWKRELGERLDALIVRTVPGVRKAVRWNSPFYGVEGQGWCLSFHVFTRFVKLTFFDGASLDPVPPGGTPKSKAVRWIDLHEGEPLDEAQLTAWVKQAAALPGWSP